VARRPRPDSGAAVGLPGDCRRVAGVHRQHRQIEVAIHAGNLGGGPPTVGEGNRHLVAAEVVGIRQHLSLGDHDTRAEAPAAPQAHDRRADPLDRPFDRLLQFLNPIHD
jgi:hypothetical protein